MRKHGGQAMSEIKEALASQGGHWYYPDGTPCYEIIGKNGKARSPYLKEAMELNLHPGVTTITGQVRKYGIEIYGKKQTAWSALTIPRLPNEKDEEFVDRILVESAEHSKLAMEKGTELHRSIEDYIRGQKSLLWQRHLDNLRDTLNQYGIDIFKGKPEHSFASPLGFGGKTDFVTDLIICDFKTKEFVGGVKQLAWPEMLWQLAAYDRGIGGPTRRRLLNVFIGIKDCEVRIHEWTVEDANRGWLAFKALLDFWQITKQYNGGKL